jgi:hypothetical protein
LAGIANGFAPGVRTGDVGPVIGCRADMKPGREAEIRSLKDQYETIWAIVNAPESQLTEEERCDLNDALKRLQEAIKKIRPVSAGAQSPVRA